MTKAKMTVIKAAKAQGAATHALGAEWAVVGEQRAAKGVAMWLRVGPAANDVQHVSTAKGLQVLETGRVPELEIDNPGSVVVLLPVDLVLNGGKQTRTVARSVLVGPRTRVRVPVRCVEAGRWSEEPSANGRLVPTMGLSLDVRRKLAREKEDSRQSRGVWEADQNSVWKHVDQELVQERLESPTRSYGVFLEVKARRSADAAAVDADVPPDANAVMLISGDTAFLEVFPDGATLRSRAAELLAELATAKRAKGTASDWLAQLGRADGVLVPAVPGTLGEPRAVRGPGVTGSALYLSGKIAHAAIALACEHGAA